MKRLKIRLSDQKFRRIGSSISKVIRIGLGGAVLLSYFFSTLLNNIGNAGSYEKVIIKSSENASDDEIRLGKEFFDCVKEAVGDKESSENSDNSHDQSLSLFERRTKLVNEIKNYLQQKRINIHNLNIYIFRDKTAKGEEEHWRIIKGWSFFTAYFAKALIVDNLTKVVNSIQNFIPGVKTEDFLFYSEVLTKVFILKLLIKLLQGRNLPSLFLEEGNGGVAEKLLENCYAIFATVLPSSYSLISKSPPLYIQQIGLGQWIAVYLCTITSSSLLEEYVEGRNTTFNENEEKNIFLRKSFQFRIIGELISYVLTSYFFSLYTAGIGKILFIVNRLFFSLGKLVVHWKDRIKERLNEKAL